MNVLYTGGSGFVGSEVLRYLLKHTDWRFTCLCSWRHKGNPLRVSPIMRDYPNRIRVITHDLSAPLPEIGMYDYIINIASDSHVDRSLKHPTDFVMNNVALMMNMLDYARTHRPISFLQFSTDEVYGAANHDEWDVLLPSNPYAASKAMQEMACISEFKSAGTPIVITNSNNIIGVNQDKEKFVPKVIDLVKNDQMVTIHTSNGKPGKRYYNPVENVAAAIQFILTETPMYQPYPTNDRPEKYSLPGGDELDNLQMAQYIASIMGKELRYKLVDAETIRPGYDQFYPKTDGKLSTMGFEPPVVMQEALTKIVEALQ